jgi:hypothetical protein
MKGVDEHLLVVAQERHQTANLGQVPPDSSVHTVARFALGGAHALSLVFELH